MKDFRSVVSDYLNKHDRHKKQLAAVVSLSMLVSFSVPMILQEPASSMTKDSFSPVGDILSTQLFNATNGNMLDNYNSSSDNNGYSPAQRSEVALLVGDGIDWAANCTSANAVVEAAKNKYFLGIAYDFSLFLEGNATLKDADAEGRVAVGGNLVFDGGYCYQVGSGNFGYMTALKDTDDYTGIENFAHAIVGGYMKNIHPLSTGNNKTRVNSKVESLGGHQGYGETLYFPDTEDKYKRFVVGNTTDSDSTHMYCNGGSNYNVNGSHDDVAVNELAEMYQQPEGGIINFTEVFTWLRERSAQLAKKSATGETSIDGNTITFTIPAGKESSDTVYFELPATRDDSGNLVNNLNDLNVNFVNVPYEEVEMVIRETETDELKTVTKRVPKCNLVINCDGQSFNIRGSGNTVNTTITYTDNTVETISNDRDENKRDEYNKDNYHNNNAEDVRGWRSNNHPASSKILYNFPNATELSYINGNFNGTIFAPNADVKSDDGCSGHLSGALIAKSFEGGLEFGYRPYRGTVDILGSSNGYAVPFDKFISGTTEHLSGATFSITEVDASNNQIPDTTPETFTIGDTTEFVNIPSKVNFDEDSENAKTSTTRYEIKEISAPTGFFRDESTKYYIDIVETVIDGVFNDPVEGGGNGAILTGRPSEVEATVTISSNDPDYTPETFNIYLKDIWGFDTNSGHDAIIRREIYIGGSYNSATGTVDNPTDVFYLDMENGNVKEVSRKSGEPLVTDESEKIQVLTTGTEYNTEINSTYTSYSTVFTDVAVTDANGSTSVDENGDVVTTIVPKLNEWSEWVDVDLPFTDDEKNNATVYGIGKIAWNSDQYPDTESITLYFKDGTSTTEKPTFNGSGNWYDYTVNKGDVIGIKIVTTGDKKGKLVIQNNSDWTNINEFEKNDINGTILLGTTPQTEKQEVKYSEVVTEMYPEATTLTEVTTYDIGGPVLDKYTALNINVSSPTTYTTVVTAENGTETAGKTYRFDPSAMMMMPLPNTYPSFENTPGLLFTKIDDSGSALQGATIELYNSNGTTVDENIWKWVNTDDEKTSYKLIDMTQLTPNVEYHFHESVTPDGYEEAKDIYFKLTDGKIQYWEDGDENNKITTPSDNGKFPFIEMVDIKKTGAKIKLAKFDADFKNRLGGATFKLCAANDEVIYPLGQNAEPFTIEENEDFDLYAALKNAGEGEYNTKYVENGYLKPGSYYLEEVNPPDGYNAGKFGFKVQKDGNGFAIVPVEAGTLLADPEDMYMQTAGDGNALLIITGKLLEIAKANPDEVFVENLGTVDQIHTSSDCSNWGGNFMIDNLSNCTFNEILKKSGKTADEIQYIRFMRWSDNKRPFDDVTSQYYDGNPSGSSGGSSSGGDYPDGVTVNSDKKSIEIKSEALSRIKSEDEIFIKFDVDKQNWSYGQIYVTCGGQNTDWQHLDTLSNHQEYSLKTLKETVGVSGDLTYLKFAVWGGNGFSNVDISIPDDSSTSDGEEQTKPEPTPEVAAGLAVRVEDDTIKIPNSKSGDKITITVEKAWQNDAGFDELRPTSIQVQLKRKTPDGQNDTTFNADSKYTATLNSKNNWKNSWTELEKLVNGDENQPYKYYVEEVELNDNYTNSISHDGTIKDGKENVLKLGSGTIKVTNTLKTIDIDVEKQWLDSNGNAIPSNSSLYSLIPTEIQVKLQYKKDGEWTDAKKEVAVDDETTELQTYTIELTAPDWKAEIKNLPECYEYRIVEIKDSKLNGWTSDSNDTANGTDKNDKTATLKNTLKTGSLAVEKVWENDSDSASSRPSVTVDIYRTTNSPASTAIKNVPTSDDDDTKYQNYAKALQYSLYFYDAQMCGDEVGDKSAVTWRDDCHTDDGDYAGGFHDAGDHAVFGLPQGFTASTLAWEYYEFQDAFDSLGQTDHYQKIMQDFCEFFVKSTELNGDNVSRLLLDKGNGGQDHSYWGSPENQSISQRGELVWTNNNDYGSNIAADYAAALAAYTLCFPDDTANKETYLRYAEALYKFSTEHNTPHSIQFDGDGGYQDGECASEQAWAAAWLYLATGTESYKTDCETKLATLSVEERGHFWGDTTLGAATVYATRINPDNSSIKGKVTGFLSKCSGDDFKVIAPGSGDWGSIRHNALAQTVALIYDRHQANPSYTEWCKKQMAYILGKNSVASNGNDSTCFVTGFDSVTSAKNIHHRAASNLTAGDDWAGWNSWSSGNYDDIEGSHTIVGALVGGNGDNSQYKDNCKDHKGNEVALDYNAGLVGAAAGLYHFEHTGTLADDDTLQALNIDTTIYNQNPVNVTNYDPLELSVNDNEPKVLSIGDINELVLKDTENNEIKDVTWTVEKVNATDDNFISVNDSGVITVLRNGTVKLKADYNGTSKTFNINVQLTSINDQQYIKDITKMSRVKSVTLTSTNDWTYTESNLPLYDKDGNEYYYYIIETGADNTGKVQGYYPVAYSDNNGTKLIQNQPTNMSVTNKKPDSSGVTMPSAGGTGTRNYYVVGACLIGLAGMFMIMRRKRETK